MKQGWEIKKLGEVCSITMGQSPSSDTYNDTDGLPFFQGNADFGKIHPSVRVYCNAPIRIAEVNDILISVRAPIGAINIADCKCCIGRGLASIRNNAEVTNEYIYHALVANKEKLIAQGTGSTFKSIGKEAIKELSIPVPPCEEQERIVAELDCLSGIFEKKKQQLKELDALSESIFYSMFGDPITNEKGWKVSNLKDVCNKITDGTHDTPERLSNGVKFITGKHIRPGIIDYENSDYVLQDVHNEIYARCNPEFGDVLYTNIGANLGTAAINVVHYEFSMKNVALLKVNKNIINGYYLQSYLNDEEVKNDIINSLSNGGAQKFLSLKMIAKISIPIPPLALQQEFADKIEAIEKQKELIKKSISETETLFNARMDYYFN